MYYDNIPFLPVGVSQLVQQCYSIIVSGTDKIKPYNFFINFLIINFHKLNVTRGAYTQRERGII